MITERRKLYNKEYYQANKEKVNARNKKYMQEHPEQRKKRVEHTLLRRRTNPDVAEKARRYNREWSKKHPGKVWKSLYSWKMRTKTEVLAHYSDGTLSCIKCGYTDIRALSLDHINDNGAEERRTNKVAKTGGTSFYHWLKRQGYPEGYQTLCMNCQNIKKSDKYLLESIKKGVGKC
jgi:hypothetical protein